MADVGDDVRRRTAPHRAPATLPGHLAGDFPFTLPAFPRRKGRAGGQRALLCHAAGGEARPPAFRTPGTHFTSFYGCRLGLLQPRLRFGPRSLNRGPGGKKTKSYRTLWLLFMIFEMENEAVISL